MVGSHSLSAVYGGSSTNATSTSAALTETVAALPTLTLASALNPSITGQATTLTATISPSTATGTITFLDGTTTLGTGTLSSGVASLSASFSSTGVHGLSASYGGDSTNLAATSATLNQTVNQAIALPAPPVSPTPVTTFAYDANGNLTQTVAASGSLNLSTNVSYDALNRPTTVTDANNGTTTTGYDGQDNVTSVTDPRSLVTTTPRDGLGQIQTLNSPDTGTATLSYDVAGNLSIRTDSRGVQGNYSYDALNRLTNVGYSLSGFNTQSYQWTYDQTASAGGFAFTNGIGRLTTASFPEGSTSYAYNAQGQVTSTLQTLNPVTNSVAGGNTVPVALNIAYGYNPAGRLASVTYPSGNQISISYNAGLPTTVSFTANGSSNNNGTPTPFITSLQFTPFGPAQSWNWAMNSGPVAHTRVFDTNGRLIRYPVGAYLQDISYDAAGRITNTIHYLAASGASTGATAPALDQSFSYDNLGHLTQAVTTPTTWAFTYDANGNRTSTTINGGTPNAYTIDAASNKLMAIATPAIALNYDAMGNTLADNNYTLTYDLRGRLATLSYSGNPTTVYTYNNDGLRVRKLNQNTGVTTLYAYDSAGHLLGEYDVNGNAIREYVWLGDMPVAVIVPGANGAGPQLYYVHADHLNTPRAVVDQNNNVVWTWYSEPFGTTAANSNPSGMGTFIMNLRFPGQVYDAESGMHYNWHRSYVPGMGRYAESDPIGLDGGQASTYSYVGGNPLSYADSKGLDYGTTSCAYYAQRCQDSGGTSAYYCKVAPLICKATPEVGNWTACVRQCLQEADHKVCLTPKGNGADTSCTVGAHVDCWAQCAVNSSCASPNLPE